MGELRLYAVALSEVHGIFGASPAAAERLRELAHRALAPAPAAAPSGMLSKLGPIFRRPPGVTVIPPTQPEPHDLDVLLAGAHVPPQRAGATWRLLETLVAGLAWDCHRVGLTASSLDDLDFALARAGVPSAVGLRHLLSNTASLNLLPVPGLTVGWHPYEIAVGMAEAYRTAAPELPVGDQCDLLGALTGWLEAFPSWAQAAPPLARPAPDLVGFWAT